MSVCYLNANYKKQYNCEYNIINTGSIEVTIDYDIEDEIEAIDGLKILGNNTKYKERDILIIDHKNKKNYLLKDAYYTGHSSVFGTPDSGVKTRFRTTIYFESNSYEKLSCLKDTPKVTKIKIFSKAINKVIGNPSLQIIKSDSECIIRLSYQKTTQEIEINNKGIKKIIVGETWESIKKSDGSNMTINFNGFIELELTGRVKYSSVSDYVDELMIFMQLYFPNKFVIDNIWVEVSKEYYNLAVPVMQLNYKEKNIQFTVKERILDFLKKCYLSIPYRNSKTEIRNIPYIVMDTSRNIEDNFLMFYRFIECYYKKQEIPNITKTFVSYSIKEHYASQNNISSERIEYYSQEIISLRNHYTHAGYFIKNSSLKVTFPRENGKKNPKDYTAKDIDVHWLYDRTKILYEIVLDIIFKKILGYEEYKFDKHF